LSILRVHRLLDLRGDFAEGFVRTGIALLPLGFEALALILDVLRNLGFMSLTEI